MATETGITEAQVLDVLRQIIDPELGINLVDLGLIYHVAIEGADVRVTMTLTTPGCPMHDSLIAGAERALARVPGIASWGVELVWDPPWNPKMINADAMKVRQRDWGGSR
jgi:metal-sulfur cluster biosynthetic enzyme